MEANESLILAVDTATPCSAIALTRGGLEDGVLLASLRLNAKLTHSRRLLAGIDWLLQENGTRLGDVDGFGVGLGPGSFTGLRIGMATMKGLASAMKTPLLGVSTLDGLACSCAGDRPLCALLDARKQEVYRRWYQKDSAGIYRENGPIAALSPAAFADEITAPCQLVGDGTAALDEAFWERVGKHVAITPLSQQTIDASAIGFLCAEQLFSKEELDLESAVPLYVRASDAELNLKKKESMGQ